MIIIIIHSNLPSYQGVLALGVHKPDQRTLWQLEFWHPWWVHPSQRWLCSWWFCNRFHLSLRSSYCVLEAWKTAKCSWRNSQHDLIVFSGDYKSFSFNTEDANHNWKNMDENFASQCKCPKTKDRNFVKKKIYINKFSTSKLNTLA